MKRGLMSVLGRAVLGCTLSWGMACGGPSAAPDPDASPDEQRAEQPAQQSTDPCAGAQGTGTYSGYLCPSLPFASTPNLSCTESLQNCLLEANANPGKSLFCTWNDRVLYRKDVSAGACNNLVCQALPGLGAYKAYTCPSSLSISIQLSSCQGAQSNCLFNANSNPPSGIYCTWKGMEIFRQEKIVGSCPRVP